ncbi:FkbM family methyltransferase [Akkermansiaceae bacterium]|nr:FkbM family methyltransferase [Akkermansiaceae bacterium]
MEKNKTFLVDKKIHEIPNYYKDKSAKFQLYEYCIISDCIRRGYKWEEHQHDLAHKYINSDSVVVEVGAHIGSLTIILSKLSKNVHCFEPLKQSYDLLRKNLLLNNCKNVITYQKGVGDEIGNTKVGYISNGNCGATILKGGSVDKYWKNKTDLDVELVTLDSLNLDRLDYLKIDVEGYEENVIKGGLNTINNFKPIIVIECMEDYNLGSIISDKTLKSRFNNLLDLGYTYKNLLSECKWEEGEKIWDILFLPKK